jgi:hypothetical protein
MSDAVVLSLPNEQRFLVLVRLALSGFASQRDLPYDRMDDLQLAVETVLAEERADGVATTLRIESLEGGVRVSIRLAHGHDGAPDGASLSRLLPTLVDRVTTAPRDADERWLQLEQRVARG